MKSNTSHFTTNMRAIYSPFYYHFDFCFYGKSSSVRCGK